MNLYSIHGVVFFELLLVNQYPISELMFASLLEWVLAFIHWNGNEFIFSRNSSYKHQLGNSPWPHDIFFNVSFFCYRLVFDRETGKPKGYGFCEYKDQETALSAMRNLNGYQLNGRSLRVDSAASEKNREEMKGNSRNYACRCFCNLLICFKECYAIIFFIFDRTLKFFGQCSTSFLFSLFFGWPFKYLFVILKEGDATPQDMLYSYFCVHLVTWKTQFSLSKCV